MVTARAALAASIYISAAVSFWKRNREVIVLLRAPRCSAQSLNYSPLVAVRVEEGWPYAARAAGTLQCGQHTDRLSSMSGRYLLLKRIPRSLSSSMSVTRLNSTQISVAPEEL